MEMFAWQLTDIVLWLVLEDWYQRIFIAGLIWTDPTALYYDD